MREDHLGFTAAEVFKDVLEDSGFSFADKVVRLESVIQKVKLELSRLLEQQSSAFNIVLIQKKVSLEDELFEWSTRIKYLKLSWYIDKLKTGVTGAERDAFRLLRKIRREYGPDIALYGAAIPRQDLIKRLSDELSTMIKARDLVGATRDEWYNLHDYLSKDIPTYELMYYSVMFDFTDPAAVVRDCYYKITELSAFTGELEAMLSPLKKKAELFEETSSIKDAMKINWLGSATDLAKLVKYLKDNAYIEAKHINVFTSEHFLVHGKLKDAKSLGGLKPDRDGRIIEYQDHLRIPRK